MYPFYERGVHCFDDVREYLSSWLNPDNVESTDTIQHNGKPHQRVAGFRRAFVTHLALFEPECRKYIFVTVRSDSSFDDDQTFPISNYQDTYDDMINDAATYYCNLWKIPPK